MTFETLTQHWQINAPLRPVYCASDGSSACHRLRPGARDPRLRGQPSRISTPKSMDQPAQRWEKPVLFQEGEAHLEQRRQTARFFTPATVQQRYIPLMERDADEILNGLRKAGKATSTASPRIWRPA